MSLRTHLVVGFLRLTLLVLKIKQNKSQATIMNTNNISSWSTGRKLVVFLLVPIFIAVVVGMASSPTPAPVQKTAEEIAYQKKHDFASLAKMNVEMMLKAPSTAKFNTSPTIKEENGIYSINSWVDSENSYGAMIRSQWSAKAHYIGGDSEDEIGTGANWIIDEFIFDGKKVK